MSEPPKDGPYVEYYDNGQKRLEIQYKNGEREGLSIGWHENGQKESEGHYKNGELVSAPPLDNRIARASRATCWQKSAVIRLRHALLAFAPFSDRLNGHFQGDSS